MMGVRGVVQQALEEVPETRAHAPGCLIRRQGLSGVVPEGVKGAFFQLWPAAAPARADDPDAGRSRAKNKGMVAGARGGRLGSKTEPGAGRGQGRK